MNMTLDHAALKAKRTCGLCTEDKPCNFERCPDDVVPAADFNALLKELEEMKKLIKKFGDYIGECALKYIRENDGKTGRSFELLKEYNEWLNREEKL